ncbi:MAG: hypothetical protein CMJ49_09590 [Planctomycetaceae bacterium]|nr:hypothetical protein [Planctomycetaceae bacterium]
MTSKQRMLAAISREDTDHIPCSFMLFFNLSKKCGTVRQFAEEQLKLGLDPYVHVGHLSHALHREARQTVTVEQADGETIFHRRIDTPAGPLETRVRQMEGWPREDHFDLFDDWLVPRTTDVLVDPSRDLDRLPYLLGDPTDEAITELRELADRSRAVADEHQLLQVGGWGSQSGQNVLGDGGVMGADAMAWLSGYEQVMAMSITDPPIIERYAQIIHAWNLKQIEVYLEVTDCDVVVRRGWYETTEFWTPEAYGRIIAPTIRAEADLVHQAGRKYGYIVTSAFLPILDQMLDAGVDVLIGLDPEEGKGTDLRAVQRMCAEGGAALWGGVSGAVTVEQGTAEQTQQATRDALDILGRDGGFILSPVDNVREDTDQAWANTQHLIDAWQAHTGQSR